MKLSNCLNCCAHRDTANAKWETECLRHRYSISEKTAAKYNWAIDYIKKEVADDRHLTAALGSAGFTFNEDIRYLANYAYAIGDKDFAAELKK